jgi:hypothetical protein
MLWISFFLLTNAACKSICNVDVEMLLFFHPTCKYSQPCEFNVILGFQNKSQVVQSNCEFWQNACSHKVLPQITLLLMCKLSVPVTAMSSVANIMTKSFCCFWKYDRSSGHRFFHNTLSESLSRLLHTSSLHPPMELVKPVRIYGSCSLAFMMKVTVWYVVSDTHKVMTVLVLVVLAVVLPELTQLLPLLHYPGV